ncbi:thioredoxin-like protein [Volvox carteri f. nagariensis]|uniref:Thioredoxin-like protein n=1 Tax=Volvox carteri f. nagariensis TaxID=3068 RepID=D8TTG0_VOLCA|nr:thioredoxin-like protein [Volvox carteri f. nagariensis]EFJ49300.1 thioredoxin-like protein [Volvox carteri f. nagariensis]|eukprot:XP_002949748.1 thioredoxin-like protein [Volvox carteri f. nagariensis]
MKKAVRSDPCLSRMGLARTLRPTRCFPLVVRAEQTTQTTSQEVKVESGVSSSGASTPPVATPPVVLPSERGNLGLAVGAVAAAVLLFSLPRFGAPAPSLATLEQRSTPLDVALTNGRPTLVEFYANWCEVCRELVPDEFELEKRYQGKVNFVMLNIENSKWAPEAAEFGVRGIPHFVFFDKTGEPLAAAVGRVPRQVLEGNLEALASDAPLPFAGAQGRTSSPVAPAGAMAGPRQTMPRDHA